MGLVDASRETDGMSWGDAGTSIAVIMAIDASRVAFIATTGFLTFLPLVLIGAVVWWVRSRFAAAEREEAARHSPELAASPSR